jgi:type I restriction enzyme R subunit
VFKKFKACITIRPQINDYRLDRDAINIVYQSLQDDREKADISQIMRELHQIVEDSVHVSRMDVREDDGVYDISKIDFERLKQEFEKTPNKKSTVMNLRDAIAQKLAAMLKRNPLRTDFQKRYEEIVDAYNQEKDRVTIEKTFEALMLLESELSEEQKRAVREGLDEESLVVFDLLSKPDLAPQDIKRIKAVAVQLLGKLKTEKLKVDNWREKQATRDAVKQTIYDFLYDERTGLPESYEEGEIIRVTENLFTHVYRVYPTVPSPVYA